MTTAQTRQDFIRAAVTFLQNPKLADSSLKDKLKFLKDKGLNEVEVDEALNLALINRQQTQNGKWNFLLIFGLCLGGYKLYKAYLASKENYMTQQKATEAQLKEEAKEKEAVEVEKKRQEEDMPTLNEILQRMAELKRLIDLQRNNFATDIQSLKTLLLGHEKFAAPPVIPAWQLKDLDEKEEKEELKQNEEEQEQPARKGTSVGNKKNKTDKNRNKVENGFNETPIAPILG